jgi:ribosomal protein L11 methyltransferase
MDKNKSEVFWEEVSFLVERELAEPIADVLREIVPGGVVLENMIEIAFPDELDLTKCPVRVSGYLPIDEFLEDRKSKILLDLQNLEGYSSVPDPVFTSLKEQVWATAWQKKYQPIPLGARIIIVPSWLDNPEQNRIPVYIDPGMAFGSGTHPTTQLSLIMLEKCIVEGFCPRMIDVGCGSGILSIAAAKLGVMSVLGLDIDPAAVDISMENAVSNKVNKNTRFLVGSVEDLLKKEPHSSLAPLVVVNIIAPVIDRLFDEGLGEIITPGGNLVLSGILEAQLADMLTLLDAQGIILQEKRQQEEWFGLWGKKR